MIRVYKNFFFLYNILIIKNLNHAPRSISFIEFKYRLVNRKISQGPIILQIVFRSNRGTKRYKNKYCTYTWKYFYITAYIFYIDSSSNLTRYPAVWKYVSRFVEYYWDYRPGYFDNKRRWSNLLHETRVESVSLADKFSRCSSSYTSV